MNPETRTVLYHCVCGASVAIVPGQSATCAACGRHYSKEAVAEDGMATLRVGDTESSNQQGIPQAILVGEDPLIGETLGHFKIIERLGRGGMGAVYRALDESLQRYVALKVIHKPGSSDVGNSTEDRHVGALLREARAQARVRHPNVVHIYYVSREADASEVPFLAMELVDGGTLADGLDIRLPTFAEAIEIAIQAAEALQQSAKFDIVHGDVKPSNILLDCDGTVRLSDFGIARRISEGSDRDLSGTPNYMSPEVCEGKPPDSRSDQYSLGVMLFEMTLGRLPYSFAGDSLKHRIDAHLNFVPEFPETWPPELPTGWRDLLQKLLEKSPEDRFGSYAELIAALKKLRPVSLPPAGHLNRLMAWGLDLVLAVLVAGMLNNVFVTIAQRSGGRSEWLAQFSISLAGTLTLCGIAFFQRKWGTSLGKKLFQLQVVDLHGLASSHTGNFARTLFQYSPLWGVVIAGWVQMLGLEGLGGIIVLVVFIFLLVDICFAAIRRDRRSIHDLIFGTKVALSAHQKTHGEGLVS